MKKMFVFILFTVTCWSQSNNFLLKDNKLIWENVYITNQENIAALISNHPQLQINSVSGNIYKGTGTKMKIICDGTSSFMDNDLSFTFEIEVRDGKYRVSVYDMVYTKSGKKKKIYPEKYIVKNGAIKPAKEAVNDLACLDSYFNKIFTLALVYKNKL